MLNLYCKVSKIIFEIFIDIFEMSVILISVIKNDTNITKKKGDIMGNKKWITKADIKKILKDYSTRPDEFEPIQKFENHYKSKFARGHVIAIEPEEIKEKDIIKGEDITSQTGKILVRHCKTNGNVIFTDIWERTKENKMQFCYRQKEAELPDNAAYVQNLKEEIEYLRKKNKELQQKFSDIANKAKIAELEELLDMVIKEKNNYQKKYQELKNDTDTKKGWNVGRKKRGESGLSKQTLELVQSILKNDPDNKKPWETYEISRAGFFRYKKLLKEKNEL